VGPVASPMKISGSYTLHSPRAQVWPVIQDPASLVRLIPGCEQLAQTAPNEYRGQMQIPVAAVAGVYATHVRLLESAEPFTTRFEGEMSGPAGAIRGNAWFRLTEGEDAAISILTYEGQGMITGPLSRMDGRIAESVARSLIGQGLANVDRQLQKTPAGVTLAPGAAFTEAVRGRTLTRWAVAVSHFLGKLVARIRSLLVIGAR
jgi:carbon monoxide dehydrogenase subunit G